jgi:hypothetical protein
MHRNARSYSRRGSTCRMREAVRTRSSEKLDTPTACVSPWLWQSASPCAALHAAETKRRFAAENVLMFQQLLDASRRPLRCSPLPLQH